MLSCSPADLIYNAIKVVVLFGQQTGAIILSVGKVPSGTWQARSVSWTQEGAKDDGAGY